MNASLISHSASCPLEQQFEQLSQLLQQLPELFDDYFEQPESTQQHLLINHLHGTIGALRTCRTLANSLDDNIRALLANLQNTLAYRTGAQEAPGFSAGSSLVGLKELADYADDLYGMASDFSLLEQDFIQEVSSTLGFCLLMLKSPASDFMQDELQQQLHLTALAYENRLAKMIQIRQQFATVAAAARRLLADCLPDGPASDSVVRTMRRITEPAYLLDITQRFLSLLQIKLSTHQHDRHIERISYHLSLSLLPNKNRSHALWSANTM